MSNSVGLILVAVLIAINCGYAIAALRRPRAAGPFAAHDQSLADQRRARWLLAFNLVVLALAASFVAMRP